MGEDLDIEHEPESATTDAALCPYCGHESKQTSACDQCRGLFEPLSRQASQNAMGPWFIRDEAHPFRPGCSAATLRALIARGKINEQTVLRGPSTRQFWTYAHNTPGVAHLLGVCHACSRPVSATASRCPNCRATFETPDDREHLGLAPVRLLPGQASPESIARHAMGSRSVAGGAGVVEDLSFKRGRVELEPDPLPIEPPAPPTEMPYLTPTHHAHTNDAAAEMMARRQRQARAANKQVAVVVILVLCFLGVLAAVLAALPDKPAATTTPIAPGATPAQPGTPSTSPGAAQPTPAPPSGGV